MALRREYQVKACYNHTQQAVSIAAVLKRKCRFIIEERGRKRWNKTYKHSEPTELRHHSGRQFCEVAFCFVDDVDGSFFSTVGSGLRVELFVMLTAVEPSYACIRHEATVRA